MDCHLQIKPMDEFFVTQCEFDFVVLARKSLRRFNANGPIAPWNDQRDGHISVAGGNVQTLNVAVGEGAQRLYLGLEAIYARPRLVGVV